MNLKVKFELNKEIDKQMTNIFLSGSFKLGGVDFSKNITYFHPKLEKVKKKNDNERKKFISEYFDEYYKKHFEELEKKVIKIEKEWRRVEKKFINQLNKIFKNPVPPKGKYIGYLSVINCNPRFLDNKTFQVFYKHKSGSNLVIAHEILHFFFYDYAVKRHTDIFTSLDTNKGIFWGLAELFNDVVMALPEFVEIHGNKDVGGYPYHEQYIDHVKKLWDNNPNIDNWLIETYNHLKKVRYEK